MKTIRTNTYNKRPTYCVKDIFNVLGIRWKSSKINNILSGSNVFFLPTKGADGISRFAIHTNYAGVEKICNAFGYTGEKIKETMSLNKQSVKLKDSSQPVELESFIVPTKSISGLQIRRESDKILSKNRSKKVQETARVNTRNICLDCAEKLIDQLNITDSGTKGLIYNLIYDSLYNNYKKIFKKDLKKLSAKHGTSVLQAAQAEGEAVQLQCLAEALFSNK